MHTISRRSRFFNTRPGRLPVAIINETTARDCFGNENPIGRHITLSHITLTKGEKTYEVVESSATPNTTIFQQPAPPTIYANLLQQDFIGSQLAIRTKSIRTELPARFARPRH